MDPSPSWSVGQTETERLCVSQGGGVGSSGKPVGLEGVSRSSTLPGGLRALSGVLGQGFAAAGVQSPAGRSSPSFMEWAGLSPE